MKTSTPNYTPEPLTPQQAINNFRLFLELSPRNSYKDYREAVCEIAQTVLDMGIQGDNLHLEQLPHFKVVLHEWDADSSIARIEINSGHEQLLVNVLSSAVKHWGKTDVLETLETVLKSK